jgi:ATP-binding cassette subfamily F protein uup
MRLGLVGRNGCGKSTLMAIIAAAAGEGGMQADAGTIAVADNVKIISFEQDRRSINPDQTLRRALAPDGDGVVYGGRSLHVVSWAKKFLFRPDQLETPVGRLSGGEQARILLAMLMRQPADILLLDEPTNDLDIPSLDVLEAALLEFSGALVLVTHDRFLLDRVCHRLIGFGVNNGVGWYADYRQWLEDLPQPEEKEVARLKASDRNGGASQAVKGKGRLSYMDQREYDTIEERIARAEEAVATLEGELQHPEVVADAARVNACWEKLEMARGETERLFQRWEELEEKRRELGC